MTTLLQTADVRTPAFVDRWVDKCDARAVAGLLERFLDVSSTVTGRATHYNAKEAQERALATIHDELFKLDRGLYALMVALDGMLDLSKQLALNTLLDNPRRVDNALIPQDLESQIVTKLALGMPVPRMLKMYGKFRTSKVNNSRTRKLILRTIIGQPADRLEEWSVRYREKLRVAITHAVGQRAASGIAAAIRAGERPKVLKTVDRAKLECIGFILGVETGLTLPKLVAYKAVKDGDWDAGKALPYETLEGLRSQYHKARKAKEVLGKTKDNLTKAQKVTFQRKAKAEQVEVEFNPDTVDAVKLYIYAYEQGMDDKVRAALDKKAVAAARALPVRFGKTRIVLDMSRSMFGSKSQKLRPAACALALRDMLAAASGDTDVYGVDGETGAKLRTGLPFPKGATSLAKTLVKALRDEPEAIFVISDGYENQPAGRFSEVLKLARDMGIQTPVYQMTPVAASEASGVKELATGLATTMPVTNPAALGAGMLRALLATDPKTGIKALVGTALKQIEYRED